MQDPPASCDTTAAHAALPGGVERRRNLRVDVDIPARIDAPDGRRFAATVRNISTSGVLVHLHAADVAALLPNIARDLPHLPLNVRLSFHLALAGCEGSVVIDCGIAHLRRIAPDRGALGMGFRHFHDGSEELLARACAAQHAREESAPRRWPPPHELL